MVLPRPRLLGPLGRRAAAGSLAVALASIGLLAGVMLVLLDLDVGNAGRQQQRSYPTSAVVAALRSAYLADGWAEAEWGPVVTLAHLEGVGLSLESGGRVLLQVPPVPKAGTAVTEAIVIKDRVVGRLTVKRSSSGLLPAEVSLRNELVASIALSAVVAAALAVSFALFASRRLVAPLHRLTVAVTRYGAGDRTTRAGVDARADEIGQLGHAFDNMAADLEREDLLRKALVADVAHELRTPLAILRAQIDALSMGITEFSAQALGSLAEETDRLTGFVDDLAVLAAADTAGLRLEREMVDVGQIARAAANRLGGRFAEHHIDLVLELLPAAALADARRLEQVVVNLLTNAEKFSPEGAIVRVTVSTQDGKAVLAVADRGPGIPEADRHQIFDRFYRGAPATSGRRVPGSGVGLAVVAEIVAAHGGSVEVDTTPGQGSTFTVRLPGAP